MFNILILLFVMLWSFIIFFYIEPLYEYNLFGQLNSKAKVKKNTKTKNISVH